MLSPDPSREPRARNKLRIIRQFQLENALEINFRLRLTPFNGSFTADFHEVGLPKKPRREDWRYSLARKGGARRSKELEAKQIELGEVIRRKIDEDEAARNGNLDGRTNTEDVVKTE